MEIDKRARILAVEIDLQNLDKGPGLDVKIDLQNLDKEPGLDVETVSQGLDVRHGQIGLQVSPL